MRFATDTSYGGGIDADTARRNQFEKEVEESVNCERQDLTR